MNPRKVSDRNTGIDSAAAVEPYAMGYTDGELKRLELQASLMGHLTEDVLRRAGLEPGMRVLDAGCGVGDVALLAADLVGPSGLVVAVDRSDESLLIAKQRAVAGAKNDWMCFETAELDAFGSELTFDAVIGRAVLMYQPDPAATVRRLARLVRPGGIVAFQEFSLPMTRTVPYAPLFRRTVDLCLETLRRAGFETDMGSKLARVFVDGGLAIPTMNVAGIAAGGPDSAVYDYYTETLRSLLPLGERFGVVTPEDVDIDTLTERLAYQAAALEACVMPPPFVGAWTRKR
jgi:ubiquinone/menaquinone biosynthesis C-methylase UbiE